MKGQHKYRATKTACNQGHSHPSKREAKRCDELHLLLRAGQIEALVYERKFEFTLDGRPLLVGEKRRQVASYKPDFFYLENGRMIAEDIKSDATMTEAFTLRAGLFRHCYPNIELRVVK